MTASSACGQCGSVLPKRALGGLCPRCLGRRVLSDHRGSRDPATEREPPGDEFVGLKIGRYELLRKIGEGGCGVVYAADQTEPVRRRVALKLVKLGMNTKAVVARFDAESQALAMMDHPGIAKVFDAGAAGDGRPYFVMELVAGIRITEYCDTNRLALRERLELFSEVCQAVHHAHQKGVIHRDLKPSNILVTVHEGVPVPKVIDFGIAKAIGEPLTDATLLTEADQVLGTPAYMSPEQAKKGWRDVDTRSDIYSLGMLLYELVAGTTAHDAARMSRADFRHAVCELDPPRPSTRLGTLPENLIETVASHRRTDPNSLRSELRGDLDWIVMKCLEKEPDRRYATASDLALDLRRHLDDQPVSAAAPGLGYTIHKFARRNKVAFVAGVLLAAILLAATTISTWLALRASHAEQLANRRLAESEDARQDAEAISKFLIRVFQSPDPGKDGRTVTVAETLGNAAMEIETDLAAHPRRRADLQSAIARTYDALGLHRDAIAIHEKVRDYYMASLGPLHSNTLQAVRALALSHDRAGHDEQALALRKESVGTHRKVYGPTHLQTIHSMIALADSHRGAGRLDEELPLRRTILELAQGVLGPEHPDTLSALRALADAPVAPIPERARHWEQLVAASRKVYGIEHRHTLDALSGFADQAAKARLTAEAQAALEELVSLGQKVLGSSHPDFIKWSAELKGFYFKEEKNAEADLFLTKSLARARGSEATNSLDLETCLFDMANLRSRQGQYANAELLYLEFLEKCRSRAGGPGSVAEMTAISLLGNNLCEWSWVGRASAPAAALRLAQRGEALCRQAVAPATTDSRVTEKRLASMRSRLAGAITAAACMDATLAPAAQEAMFQEAEALLVQGSAILRTVRWDQPTN